MKEYYPNCIDLEIIELDSNLPPECCYEGSVEVEYIDLNSPRKPRPEKLDFKPVDGYGNPVEYIKLNGPTKQEIELFKNNREDIKYCPTFKVKKDGKSLRQVHIDTERAIDRYNDFMAKLESAKKDPEKDVNGDELENIVNKTETKISDLEQPVTPPTRGILIFYINQYADFDAIIKAVNVKSVLPPGWSVVHVPTAMDTHIEQMRF